MLWGFLRILGDSWRLLEMLWRFWGEWELYRIANEVSGFFSRFSEILWQMKFSIVELFSKL